MTSVSDLRLKFHPVGQGLFASGMVAISNGGEFHWVYDCGTSSKKAWLAKALDDYESPFVNKKIDLVVLSHFDKDHISGLVDLLTRFKVGILMLPFVPLWLRLAIALSSNVRTGSRLFQYFVNPAKAFASLQSIDTILLVPSPIDEAGPGDRGRQSLSEGNDTQPTLSWPTCTPTREMQSEIKTVEASNMEVLPVAGGIKVQDAWEFLPYNDRTVAAPPPHFVATVESLRDKLLASPGASELDALKREYDKQFGSTSRPRNLISLFLYAGPLTKPSKPTTAIAKTTEFGNKAITTSQNFRLGALYTGDGYLNNPGRLDAFVNFYGTFRIEQCLCFQVMHHGAKNNWRIGTGARIAPTHSIFSAGQLRKKPIHPSGEVVKDFTPFGACIVYELNAFEVQVS